jgi:hypothetical protein
VVVRLRGGPVLGWALLAGALALVLAAMVFALVR